MKRSAVNETEAEAAILAERLTHCVEDKEREAKADAQRAWRNRVVTSHPFTVVSVLEYDAATDTFTRTEF